MQLNLLILSLATAAAALPYGNLPRENPMPAPPAAKPQDNHATRDSHMTSIPIDNGDEDGTASTQDSHMTDDSHMTRDNGMPAPPIDNGNEDGSVSSQDNHMTGDNHMPRDNNMPSPPSAKPQDNHATRRDNQMPAPPVDNGGD